MVKNFKGFKYEGSIVLGYRMVPVSDTGIVYSQEISINSTGREVTGKDFNCDRNIKKITYRKFMKSANRK